MLKVLDVGSGLGSEIDKIFTGQLYEVTKLDVNRRVKPDIRHDITKPLPKRYQDKFDAAICFHFLEHVDRALVISVMINIAGAVKPGGVVWVTVPSFEWAAREIMAGRDNSAVQYIVFGAQYNPWDYHRIGFTLGALKEVITRAGLEIEVACQQEIIVHVQDAKCEALQNLVKARKR
jgi:predicted SAM-dependent methyltransferase